MSVKPIAEDETNEELIKFLEGLIEEAKSGEIISCAVVLGHAENSVSNTWFLNKKTYRKMIQAEVFNLLMALVLPSQLDGIPE